MFHFFIFILGSLWPSWLERSSLFSLQKQQGLHWRPAPKRWERERIFLSTASFLNCTFCKFGKLWKLHILPTNFVNCWRLLTKGRTHLVDSMWTACTINLTVILRWFLGSASARSVGGWTRPDGELIILNWFSFFLCFSSSIGILKWFSFFISFSSQSKLLSADMPVDLHLKLNNW